MSFWFADWPQHWRSAGVACALWCFAVPHPASAQIGMIGGTDGPSLTPPPVVADHDNPFAKPTRDYQALPIGGWLLYPSLFLGGLYDSNPAQSATTKTSSFGGRVVPSLLAEATDGINKSTYYGMMDARAYSADTASTYDTISARTGFMQKYQPTADLVVNAQADYTRQRDLFSTFGIDNSVNTLNPTAIGLSPTANPITYNQYSATASVQKTFGAAFLTLGGSAVDIAYDNTGTPGAPSPNGVTYTGVGRGGVWFTPALYAYAEGSVDQRHYSTSEFNSSGYRAVGGIGTDQLGLFKGELYGGYQVEQFDFSPLGNVASSVFGGSIYYYPLPELTLRASVNELLGVSLAAAAPGALGTSTKADTALVQATYSLAKEWMASARFGYIRTSYTDVVRTDNAWTAGGTVTYSVWQNFGITLDYQYVQLASNVPLQSFTRNVVTLGLTYRY
jgi:hypothetical protein